jgi:transcriptional regulator with XRE-family HTH domain
MPTIREWRERRGLSQQELADKALVSIPAISRLENERPVSRATFRRVCKALDVKESEVSGVRFTEDRNRTHLRDV